MSGELPPELIQQLIDLGVISDQNDTLVQQIAQARKMRTPKPHEGASLRSSTGGDMYIAPSPLSVVGDFVNAWRGKKQEQGLQEQRAALLQKQQAARGAFAQQLLGGRTPPTVADPQAAYLDQYRRVQQQRRNPQIT